jgi:hypothetical protein
MILRDKVKLLSLRIEIVPCVRPRCYIGSVLHPQSFKLLELELNDIKVTRALCHNLRLRSIVVNLLMFPFQVNVISTVLLGAPLLA